jgi:hypothetical protein
MFLALSRPFPLWDWRANVLECGAARRFRALRNHGKAPHSRALQNLRAGGSMLFALRVRRAFAWGDGERSRNIAGLIAFEPVFLD